MDAIKRKRRIKKYELLKTSWNHQAKEYFENTNLHGIRYIAEADRPLYEKLMWFMFVTISTIVTLIIIISLWDRFQTNPTITGLDTDFHNWDVPFPGVTLCPNRPASPERLKAFVKKRWGDSLSEDKVTYYIEFMTLISNLSYSNLKDIAAYKNDRTLPQENFKELVYEVLYRCEDILMECDWKGKDYDCCSAFLPTFTEHGFCYSFNTLYSESDWSWKEKGLKFDRKTKFIYETDVKWTIEFDANVTESSLKIYIHSWDELPGVEMSPQHIWTKTVNKMFFASRTTYTTEDARQLSAKQRKCIFQDEVKLKTSPKYSYWACMTDCRMRASLKKCNCVPFFYHHVEGFPYCNLEGMLCLSKVVDELLDGLNCPCELCCMNTVYEIEKLDNAPLADKDPIEIGFVSWPMFRYKREVLFGWVDLLVAFGGIAGLFLGFSLLSGVEIVYYFTVRAVCMVRQEPETLIRLEEESGSQMDPQVDLCLGLKRSHTVQPLFVPKKKHFYNVPFLN